MKVSGVNRGSLAKTRLWCRPKSEIHGFELRPTNELSCTTNRCRTRTRAPFLIADKAAQHCWCRSIGMLGGGVDRGELACGANIW